MSRKHALPMVVLVGAASIVGVLALSRTAGLGANARTTPVPVPMFAAHSRALDRVEAPLKRSLARRSPKRSTVPAAVSPHADPSGTAPRVVDLRSKSIVVHARRGGDDDGYEIDDGYETEDERDTGDSESGDD